MKRNNRIVVESYKDWGLTDCISFVVMRQEVITEAFTVNITDILSKLDLLN